jgi:polar amino acid transport system permease protein
VDGRSGGRAGASLSTDRRAVREAARRRRAQRGAAISALSTVVVLGALAALILTSQGWPNVRDTFFSWTAFRDAFPDVLDGFWLDIKIFVVVEIAVLVLGLVVAVVRSTRTPALFPVRMLGATYTDVFRGIPTILCVYLIGFGIPALELSGLPTDPVVLGGIALTLSYSAYVARGVPGRHRLDPRGTALGGARAGADAGAVLTRRWTRCRCGAGSAWCSSRSTCSRT